MLDGEAAGAVVDAASSLLSPPDSVDWLVDVLELAGAAGEDAEGGGAELPVEPVPGFCVTLTSCVPSVIPP